jgi:hypothetical protein
VQLEPRFVHRESCGCRGDDAVSTATASPAP